MLRFVWLLALSLPCVFAQAQDKIRVLAWSERSEPADVYPRGINGQFAEFLKSEKDIVVKTANITDPEQGLSEEALAAADVVIWFGHKMHARVTDENVDRVLRHIRTRGMGFMPIHSSHYSKPFQKLMVRIAEEKGVHLDDTPGKWAKVRNEGAAETIQVIAPRHPIAHGITEFTIPKTETYWNPFVVPPPDTKIFAGRSDNGMQDGSDGLLWRYGKGQVFYFRPGHETYPIYFQPEVQRVLKNAVRFLGTHPKK
jgi:trehalose utilization protein